MRGSQLKRIATVCDLAKVDFAPGPLSLSPTAGGTLGWYGGQLLGGGVEAEGESSLERAVSVNPTEFQAIAALFDNDTEVKLRAEEKHLALIGQRRRLSLGYYKTPSSPEAYQQLAGAAHCARIGLGLLRSELALAAQATAQMGLLAGIRIVSTPDRLILQSSTGVSRVFLSTLPSVGHEETQDQLVAPVAETMAALKLMAGSSVDLLAMDRSFAMRSENAVVRVPLLSGTWPAFNRLRGLVFNEHLEVPARSLIAAIRAAAAFDHHDIIFSPDGQGATVITSRGQNPGQFEEQLAGAISLRYTFAADDLILASKLVAPVHDIRLAFADNLALVSAGLRKLYLNLRVSP